MNSKDFFEKYFKSKIGHCYSPSLLNFFNQHVRSRLGSGPLQILDLGPGSYSLFEDIPELNAHITAIDFSKNAIDLAPPSAIHYRQADIVDSKNFPVETFDLIFDSHCLNCLSEKRDRDQAFKNVYCSLKEDGIFASEMMVQPIGRKVSMPFKKIKTSLELEQEIVDSGFKIKYFMISRENVFFSEIDGEEVKCDLVNIVAQK